MEVFDAELFSILQAIKDVENHFKNRPSTKTNQITNIYIFADSQAALSRISNLALRPGQAVINQITKISESIVKRHQVKIQFEWIPAHQNIPGNEMADQAAKKGAKNEFGDLQDQGYTSFTHIQVGIKQACLSDWKEFYQKTKNGQFYQQNFANNQPKWKASKITVSKAVWAASMQLKFGHGYFKSYLAKLPNYENNYCFGTCRAIQSPEHLLLSCPAFREERRELREKIGFRNLTIPLLYSNSEYLTHTLDFIRKTGIATRKWFLDHTNAA